jgi:hypothetical protein
MRIRTAGVFAAASVAALVVAGCGGGSTAKSNGGAATKSALVISDALLVAEHAHDATADLDADGWQGTMNYAGFIRPLWTWLRSSTVDLQNFLGVPVPIPLRDGPSVVATMREFAARRSWRALTHSWNLLGAHDTARIRTVAATVFAGDELGLEATTGGGCPAADALGQSRVALLPGAGRLAARGTGAAYRRTAVARATSRAGRARRP